MRRNKHRDRNKRAKLKYKCSDCGKVYYRVWRPYMEEKHLYCTICQYPTLEEVIDDPIAKRNETIDNLIGKEEKK